MPEEFTPIEELISVERAYLEAERSRTAWIANQKLAKSLVEQPLSLRVSQTAPRNYIDELNKESVLISESAKKANLKSSLFGVPILGTFGWAVNVTNQQEEQAAITYGDITHTPMMLVYRGTVLARNGYLYTAGPVHFKPKYRDLSKEIILTKTKKLERVKAVQKHEYTTLRSYLARFAARNSIDL